MAEYDTEETIYHQKAEEDEFDNAFSSCSSLRFTPINTPVPPVTSLDPDTLSDEHILTDEELNEIRQELATEQIIAVSYVDEFRHTHYGFGETLTSATMDCFNHSHAFHQFRITYSGQCVMCRYELTGKLSFRESDRVMIRKVGLRDADKSEFKK